LDPACGSGRERELESLVAAAETGGANILAVLIGEDPADPLAFA
jgi:hypothetical protein